MSVNQTEMLTEVESLTPGRTLLRHYTSSLLKANADEQAGLERLCESALAKVPKYTATILDAASANDRAFKYTCAVFIVPQGMELDWLVSTPEGQAQVVAGADAARVFLVTLNRGHTFDSAEEIQRELSPWIQSLVPKGNLPPVLHPGSIPYTTTPQGIGHRTVLLEMSSQIEGPIIVEDVCLVEPGRAEPTTFRRMIFLDSPSLIQSEAVLIDTELEMELQKRSGAGVSVKRDQQEREPHCVKRGNSDCVSDAATRVHVSDTCATCGAGGLEQGRKREMGEEDLERDHRKKKRRKDRGAEEGGVWGLGTEVARLEVNESDQDQAQANSSLTVSSAIDPRVSVELDSEDPYQLQTPQVEIRAERTNADVRNGTALTASDRGQSRVRTPGLNEASSRGLEALTSVDFSYLASEYLAAMVAGLAFLAADLDDRTASEGLLDVLVVGLGGGGMPMFLRRHLACRVEVIEIDPTVAQLATTYFGVSSDSGFQVHVADAIPWIIAAAEGSEQDLASKGRRGSFDAVLIDVESAGGKCPPPAFLELSFLLATRSLLRPRGLVALNVVADDEERKAVYDAVQEVFKNRLHEWSVPQNSNRVLFAHRKSKPTPYGQPQTVRNDVGEPMPPNESGALVTCKQDDDVSGEDDVDLVYWASRLVERGVQTRPWGRGPDLPELASNIRPLCPIGSDKRVDEPT